MQESGYVLEDAMKKHKAGHAAGRRGFLKGVAAGGASALTVVFASRLIADDAPEFRRTTPDTILGTCPDILSDFLEVRGLGILNVRAMYGNNAVITEKRLHLIIQLQLSSEDTEPLPLDRLRAIQHHRHADQYAEQ